MARWSHWLRRMVSRVRNLIDTPQKYIRVTEIREDTNSTLRGQSCRSTPRANANERNANTATCTSIPNSVTNIHSAGKWLAISFGGSLLGKPHNGLPVEGVIRRCRRMVVKAHPGTGHLEAGGITPTSSGKRHPMRAALCEPGQQPVSPCNRCKGRL